MEQRKNDRRYTYADYVTWSNDERYELIDGVPYAMAPSPSMNHQLLHAQLFGRLFGFLDGKPCKVISAPIDVRFEDDDTSNTVVQPDIVVVCDKDKIKSNGIVGSPTLIIEIISPSTALYDCSTKNSLYEMHGVPEYWIVSPPEKMVTQYLLVDGRYARQDWREGDLESKTLTGFSVNIDSLFESMF